MRKSLCPIATLVALAATPAAAAPFAILHLDTNAIRLLDLGTLEKVDAGARYDLVFMVRDAPKLGDGVLDRAIQTKEADCAGQRVRLLRVQLAVSGGQPYAAPWSTGPGDWTEVEAEELRLACTGQLGGLQVIPALDVARVILNRNPDRPAD